MQLQVRAPKENYVILVLLEYMYGCVHLSFNISSLKKLFPGLRHGKTKQQLAEQKRENQNSI